MGTITRQIRRRARRTGRAGFAAAVGAILGVAATSTVAQTDDDAGNGDDGDDAYELGEISIEGAAPSPFDPVGGYSAERSATATRMNLSLEETPAPVQVVPREVLEDSGADRVDDALDFTAGTQKTNTFGGSQEGILLRGFRATFSEDGVTAGGGAATSSGVRDSATVERVEVLRGPGSALYGEGSPGGVVNVITKRPQRETFFETESSASSFTRLRQTFDANTAFGTDKRWQTRVSGAVEYSDSFRDEVDSNRQVVAPAITFEPNNDVRVHYRGEYQRDAGEFDRGVPIDDDGDLLTDDEDFFGDPDDGDNEVENFGSQLEAEVDLTETVTARVLGSWDRSTFDGDATEPRLLAPFDSPPLGNFPSLTANESVLRIQRRRDQETNIWTGRAELTGNFATGPVDHQVLVSVEIRDINRDADLRQSSIFGTPDVVDIGSQQIDTPSLPRPGVLDSQDDITNYGIVAFNRIKPIAEISILAGGRFDIVDQTQVTRSRETKIDESEFSPTVGAVVRPVEWGSVFARYSQSFKVNTDFGANNQPLPPQEGESIEGGLRVNLRDGAVQGTLTVFNIELENEPQPAGLTGSFQVPATRESTGVEVSLQGALTEQLSLIANYTYTDAELSDVPGPRDGERPPGVPEHAANLFAKYDVAAAPLDGVSLTGGVVYNGDRLNASSQQISPPGFPTFTTGGKELDSYVRLDLGASYEIKSWLDAGFKVENVTDTDYSRPSVPGFTLPEPGRTFSGRVRLRF